MERSREVEKRVMIEGIEWEKKCEERKSISEKQHC